MAVVNQYKFKGIKEDTTGNEYGGSGGGKKKKKKKKSMEFKF